MHEYWVATDFSVPELVSFQASQSENGPRCWTYELKNPAPQKKPTANVYVQLYIDIDISIFIFIYDSC